MICELSITAFLMIVIVGVVIWHVLLTKENDMYKQLHEIRMDQKSMAATQRSQEKFMVELETKVQATTGKFNLLKEDFNKLLVDLEDPDTHQQVACDVEQLELRMQQLEVGLAALEPKKPKKDK